MKFSNNHACIVIHTGYVLCCCGICVKKVAIGLKAYQRNTGKAYRPTSIPDFSTENNVGLSYYGMGYHVHTGMVRVWLTWIGSC